MGLEEGLQAGYIPDNHQTRMLSDDVDFAGACTEEQLEAARENLGRFAAVGLTEEYEEAIAAVCAALGLTPHRYKPRAVNPSPPRVQELTDAELEAVRAHNRLDELLYAIVAGRSSRFPRQGFAGPARIPGGKAL
jgi:hypothetical protein